MALQDENVARAFAESLLVDLGSILQIEIGETLPMTWPVVAENQHPAELSWTSRMGQDRYRIDGLARSIGV